VCNQRNEPANFCAPASWSGVTSSIYSVAELNPDPNFASGFVPPSDGLGLNSGMYVATSRDGLHFYNLQYTGVKASMQVKRYYGPGTPPNGIFVGVTTFAGRTYFNWSTDNGATWKWSDPNKDLNEMGPYLMGWSGVLGLCVAPGTPSLAADGLGEIIERDGTVVLVEGEGKFGPADAAFLPIVDETTMTRLHSDCLISDELYRGSTWHLYGVQGRFTFVP